MRRPTTATARSSRTWCDGSMHRSNWREVRAARASGWPTRCTTLGVRRRRPRRPRWPGTRTATWSCTSACPAWARCCTRSTRGCSRSRSPTSSTTPRTAIVFFDPELRAAGGGAGAAAARRCKALRRPVPRRPAARDRRCRACCSYEDAAGRRAAAISTGRRSTRTRPRRCATPPAPPATPRACSTATARRCCTRSPPAPPTAWRLSRARQRAARRAAVPRQRLGHALCGARCAAPSWCCPARA